MQADVVGERRGDTGRRVLDGDQVLRVALLEQIHGLSYRELEFHLQDSEAFRALAGLGLHERPSDQALFGRAPRQAAFNGGFASFQDGK